MLLFHLSFSFLRAFPVLTAQMCAIIYHWTPLCFMLSPLHSHGPPFWQTAARIATLQIFLAKNQQQKPAEAQAVALPATQLLHPAAMATKRGYSKSKGRHFVAISVTTVYIYICVCVYVCWCMFIAFRHLACLKLCLPRFGF